MTVRYTTVIHCVLFRTQCALGTPHDLSTLTIRFLAGPAVGGCPVGKYPGHGIRPLSRAAAECFHDLSEVTDCATFNRVDRLERMYFGKRLDRAQFTSLHPRKAL